MSDTLLNYFGNPGKLFRNANVKFQLMKPNKGEVYGDYLPSASESELRLRLEWLVMDYEEVTLAEMKAWCSTRNPEMEVTLLDRGEPRVLTFNWLHGCTGTQTEMGFVREVDGLSDAD